VEFEVDLGSSLCEGKPAFPREQ